MSGTIKNAVAALSLLMTKKKTGNTGLLVLCYHKIVPNLDERLRQWAYLDCKSFERQIDFMGKSGMKFLSEDDFIDGLTRREFPENSVLVTFDDGSFDNYVHAFPILKKYRVPAIIFLTTGFIGSDKIFWWDRLEGIIFGTQRKELKFCYKGRDLYFKLGAFGSKCEVLKALDVLIKENMSEVNDIIQILIDSAGYGADKMQRSAMNWSEVREMSREGIGFGAHTVSHPRLSFVSKEEASREIEDSKLTIENKLEKSVNLFAYPYGGEYDVPPFAPEILRELSFKAGFTTSQGSASVNDDPMLMPRIALSGIENFTVFKAKLFSQYFDMIKMIKKARKAILCGHK